MSDSNRVLATLVVALTLTAAAACSEDPAAPPIEAGAFGLEVRNLFNTDPIRGVNEAGVEFQVVVDGAAEARLAEIRSMAVRFPAGAPKIPVPTEFEARESGALSARAYYERGTGLTQGDYTLEIHFVTGDTVTVTTPVGVAALGAPQVLEVVSEEGTAGVRWRAPGSPHTWRVALERFDATSETVIANEVEGSSGGGGTFAIGYDLTRDPDAVYGLVIYLANAGNHRRFVVPI